MDKYLIRKNKDDPEPSGSKRNHESDVLQDNADRGNQLGKRVQAKAVTDDVVDGEPGNKPGNRLAIWLNSLSLIEAVKLREVMVSLYTITLQHFLDDSASDIILLSNIISPERDGKWYVDIWLSCEIIDLDKGSPTVHPRWQLDVGSTQGMIERVRRFLSAGSWNNLRAIPQGKRRQVKLMAHHVSYNAQSLRERAPIPLDCGFGGSISHFCDQRGCIKQSHLEATPHHVNNMERQRCSGVRLIIYSGVIVQEVPCPHGEKEPGLTGQLLRSCRKLLIVQLTAATLVRVQEVQKNSKIASGE